MTFEEIKQYRQELLNILNINPEGEQHQPLRNLAKKVGAQQPNAKNVEFRDMIVNNINHALQTASMIEMCKTAAEGYEMATKVSRNACINFWIAAAIAFLSAVAAWVAVLNR